MNAHLQKLFFTGTVGAVVLDGVQNFIQLITKEHGYDGRRRLAGAKTVIVAGAGHGNAKQILVFIHRLDNGSQEQKELGIFRRRFAGIEQIHTCIGGDGPVVMLTAAVHTGKRLFMKQADQIVLARRALHNLHSQLVVIGGDIGGGEDGGQLVLSGSRLVMLRLGQDAKLPKLLIDILHKGGNPGLDNAEIVIVQLLSLGGLGAEQGAAGVDQILTAVKHLPRNEEILLLRTDGGLYRRHVRVSEQAEHTQGLLVDRLHRTEEGRFLVQRLAAVGAEGGGNAQHAVLYKRIRSGIPGRISSGLKGGTQSAGGEGGGIRLALDQLLAGKLHNHATAVGGGNEAVVLLRRDARHGLEPVGEMGSPLLDGPILHSVGHHVGDTDIQTLADAHSRHQGAIGILGQPLPHHRVVEHLDSENLCN